MKQRHPYKGLTLSLPLTEISWQSLEIELRFSLPFKCSVSVCSPSERQISHSRESITSKPIWIRDRWWSTFSLFRHVSYWKAKHPKFFICKGWVRLCECPAGALARCVTYLQQGVGFLWEEEERPWGNVQEKVAIHKEVCISQRIIKCLMSGWHHKYPHWPHSRHKHYHNS